MLVDARTIAPGTALRCDICVVGAGPAGIAVVDRLRGSGLSVVLVESGGFEPDIRTQGLYRGENIGHDYYRIDACRYRYFGGSTNRWGGWCRPLDPEDFERQEWLPWSGWPISEQVLRPFYADASALFGLPSSRFDLASWEHAIPPGFPLDGSNFQNAIFQYNATSFGTAYRSRLIEAPDVTTILHANLVRMDLAADSSRVESLRFVTLTKRDFCISPRAVVLAAGGIENARLLLASRHERSKGLGNHWDMVGRFFMEHLHVGAGHILVAPSNPSRSFYRRSKYRDGTRVGGMIMPTRTALENHRLLTTSIAVESASYTVGPPRMSSPNMIAYSAIRQYQKVSSGRFKFAAEAVKQNLLTLMNVSRRYETLRKATLARARARTGSPFRAVYSLYFRSAQAPDPNSRVTLSQNYDELGVPEIALNWRINTIDIDSIATWIELLGEDLRTHAVGEVIPPPSGWQNDITGGPHHIGTTRMSSDPKRGVVDEHCRVHSVDNLYITGSSVFPTGGYANPTFTIVALALRLADTLRDRLSYVHFAGSRA